MRRVSKDDILRAHGNLAAAVLQQAAVDAVCGDPRLAADGWAYLLSPQSKRWAALLGAGDRWPPTRRQLEAAQARRWQAVDDD